MSLYKYIAKEDHAVRLINAGEIFFWPLSYFRQYEDGLVRGDPDDGTRWKPIKDNHVAPVVSRNTF